MYGNLVDADAYHLARGRGAWVNATEGERTAALVRASDWIDLRFAFSGVPVGDAAWPRTGTAFGDDEVPPAVTRAAYEAAFVELTPGALAEPVKRITSESVTVGPISESFQYADPVLVDPAGVIGAILAGLVVRKSNVAWVMRA